MKGYRKDLVEEMKAYKADVERVVASGFFKDSYRARRYVDEQLGPIWGSVLGDSDPESISADLEMPDTLRRIVHFFALGVHGFRAKKYKKAVILTQFPPTGDEDRPVIRAVHKRDVARIVGRSQSATEEALNRISGNKHEDSILHRKRICYSMPVATGVMLDVMTCAQLSLLNFVEYDTAKEYARDQHIGVADRSRRTMSWCNDKTEPASLPSEEGVEPDVVESARVGASA